MEQVTRSELVHMLDQGLTTDGLRHALSDLESDWDLVPGEAKRDKLCSLVIDYERRGRIDDLVSFLNERYSGILPSTPWKYVGGSELAKRAARSSAQTVKVFYSYSHKDEDLRTALEEHLSLLRWEGAIKDWHDRKIGAGKEWEGQIDSHLNTADLILLLVSSSFIASPYCRDKEMARAMQRHGAGKARVIPVILRPCEWHPAPFGKLQALPKDGKPITLWSNRDEAFLDVVRGIRATVEDLRQASSTNQEED